MFCPKCGEQAEVYDSRPAPQGTTRRRLKCPGCSRRWSTIEVVTHEILATGTSPTQPDKRPLHAKPIIFYPSGKVRVFDTTVIASALAKVFGESPK